MQQVMKKEITFKFQFLHLTSITFMKLPYARFRFLQKISINLD